MHRAPAESVTAADRHPFVAPIARYSATVLRPTALATDRDGVAAGRIAELADLGLLNHQAPAAWGGPGIDRDGDRRIHELVAGGCFNTWLVWAQHATLVGRLTTLAAAGSPLPESAQRALRGEILLGAGVSDVRRYPDRYIAATRRSGGWVFTGTISWVSGWGLNTVLTVAAVDRDSDTVVTALVDVVAGTRSLPLELSAVAGSRTERVWLDQVFVPDENVIERKSLADWHTTDLDSASDARAHHFGLAETVLDELEHTGHQGAFDVAAVWRPRVAEIRSTAYRLSDEAKASPDQLHRLEERLATKVAVGEALATLTRALVVAHSGHGIGLDNTAQLHARSAMFVLVQGQHAQVRDRQLRHLAR